MVRDAQVTQRPHLRVPPGGGVRTARICPVRSAPQQAHLALFVVACDAGLLLRTYESLQDYYCAQKRAIPAAIRRLCGSADWGGGGGGAQWRHEISSTPSSACSGLATRRRRRVLDDVRSFKLNWVGTLILRQPAAVPRASGGAAIQPACLPCDRA